MINSASSTFKYGLRGNSQRAGRGRCYTVLINAQQDFHRFGTAMVEAFQQQPSMINYVSYPPMKDVSDYYQYWQLRMHDAKVQIFAILLKAGTVTKKDAVTGEKHEFQVEDGTFAGVTGLIDGNREWASVEVAHVSFDF